VQYVTSGPKIDIKVSVEWNNIQLYHSKNQKNSENRDYELPTKCLKQTKFFHHWGLCLSIGQSKNN